MAVEVILTIASRRLRIFGSGTCSTRTSFLPYQQFALITSPFFGNPSQTVERLRARRSRGRGRRSARRGQRRLQLPPLPARHGLRGPLRHVAVVPDRAVRDDQLARLHQLLERAQRLLRLLARLLAEELRAEGAAGPAR